MKNKYKILCLFICFMRVTIFAQTNSNFQCSIIDFPKVIKHSELMSINILVTSLDKEINEDVIVNISIDGALIATKNVHLAIPDQKSQEVTIKNVFDISVAEHQLKIEISNKFNQSLYSFETDFLVARTTVPQLPLIEEFTSSTCPPCASFNSTFDPFLSSINTNADGAQAAAVKYQMNWPSPDDDPSYNSDGNGRRNAYGVSSIPKSYLNGILTSTFNQSVIDGASGESAFNLTPYFYLSGDTVKATVTATSYTTMSSPLRLHLALTEDYYEYTGGTTSQTEFHYVTRKMLPNYVGTIISNIHEDTTYTVNKNYKVTYGNVAQNNYNIWATSAGFTLVSWVQNTTTKEVYQAAFANTPSALNITENFKNKTMEVFPNPTSENFTIKLVLDEKAEVSYTINDVTGKLIQQPVIQLLPAGKHILQTSTQNLLPGIYFCNIKANDTVFTERIVVTK